ncbi:MAG: DNA repair protein RadC [Blautia sp.]|nr:DNA repair protein RadC [Blautia sp.]
MKEKISDIPKDQRPYEKCAKYGPEALSDSELLAVILRTGTKERNALSLANLLLTKADTSAYPGLTSLLHFSMAELRNVPGIGEVKAVQLKCVGELSRRISAHLARPGITFHDPKSIADYFMELLRHQEQEQLYSLMMDARGHNLGECLISMGTVDGTIASPREIFIEALQRRAVGFVLVHNHPSGSPEPSQVDRELTRTVYLAGKLLKIDLLDHIIIGDQKYYSFQEQGFFCEDIFFEDIWDRFG